MSNRKWIFINLLTKETELSYDEAKSMIESLPEKYINESIRWYDNGGIHALRLYIEGVSYLGNSCI